MRLLICLILLLIFHVLGCSYSSKTNYIGKNKEDVAKLCESYFRFSNPISKKENQIMIRVNGVSSYYFNSVSDILNSQPVKNANTWDIDFTEWNMVGKRYFVRLTFKDNIVEKQKNMWERN